MTLTICIVVGIVGLGALGMTGRRSTSMAEWTVNGRGFQRWTSWFLQAGDSLTTFSFLGLAGIAFGGGVIGVFALAYLSISSIGLYFCGPRMRQLGQDRGYLTQADFFADRFSSPALGRVSAVVGAVFLLPYLQLQITGLGLVVELATGSESGRGLSMVVASALVVIFVAWSGIRGIARVAVVKDVLMLAALLIVLGGVVFGIAGIPDTFAHIKSVGPQLLDFSQTGWDTTFFLTAVIVTSIGAGLNTFPHLWPPVLAAKTGAVLRSNYKWLALYQLMLFVPIFVGLAATKVLPADKAPKHVLLSVAKQTLPSWLVAVVAIAGASAAMVPAAAIAMGISSLVSKNLIRVRRESLQLTVNLAAVVGAIALSLVLGLANFDIASLLLLTYGGLTQMAPATLIGLGKRVNVGAVPVMLGMVVGVVTVAWITFFEIPIGSWDSGLIALAPNLAVLAVAELVRRRMPSKATVEERPAPATVEV
ncbi:sodium:solute symporter [Nostocoides sp. HKS02]|uniref:sodium:solute symporter family protein n=1 Tax=Nostocoides sp. HKS02 TaxID=1813880 RepID=UPI0012B48227|nr:sodium:solute symporter family protein [Tetrasphaera sp. HKS02]QGN57313.1 sodium:solute symporter family protein [Tetrasphaera sp. HKS02]